MTEAEIIERQQKQIDSLAVSIEGLLDVMKNHLLQHEAANLKTEVVTFGEERNP